MHTYVVYIIHSLKRIENFKTEENFSVQLRYRGKNGTLSFFFFSII